MQIVATIVGQTSFCDRHTNTARVTQAQELFKRLTARPALVVLPAGYLAVPLRADTEQLIGVATPLLETAKSLRIGVVIGIDKASPSTASQSSAAGEPSYEVYKGGGAGLSCSLCTTTESDTGVDRSLHLRTRCRPSPLSPAL